MKPIAHKISQLGLSEIKEALKNLEGEWQEDFWPLEEVIATFNTGNCLLFIGGTEPQSTNDADGVLFIKVTLQEAEILYLFVANSCRGQGLAKSMLGHGIKQLKKNGVQTVYLEVKTSNSAAQNVYLDAGFQITAHRKKYYRNGQDAYQMTLNI